jgi:hypothetical protein
MMTMIITELRDYIIFIPYRYLTNIYDKGQSDSRQAAVYI